MSVCARLWRDPCRFVEKKLSRTKSSNKTRPGPTILLLPHQHQLSITIYSTYKYSQKLTQTLNSYNIVEKSCRRLSLSSKFTAGGCVSCTLSSPVSAQRVFHRFDDIVSFPLLDPPRPALQLDNPLFQNIRARLGPE